MGNSVFFSGDEPYNDSNNDDVPPCASHCVHFNGAKLSFHKWEGCERKQTFLEFFLQFSSIETVFQVQTMILAVSGSTANTADPLDGNGVTPVYAGPWIHQKKTQILQICRTNLMNGHARRNGCCQQPLSKVHPKNCLFLLVLTTRLILVFAGGAPGIPTVTVQAVVAQLTTSTTTSTTTIIIICNKSSEYAVVARYWCCSEQIWAQITTPYLKIGQRGFWSDVKKVTRL